MQISYSSSDSVSLKIKNETCIVGNGVQIGSYSIQGAGEYDIAAIQCEAVNLEHNGIAYFIRAEDLTVTFLSEVDTTLTKLDYASKTDILAIDIRSDAKVEDVKSIIKAVEPSYVFLIGSGSTPEFQALLGIPMGASGTLKVTRTSLPLEGIQLIPR